MEPFTVQFKRKGERWRPYQVVYADTYGEAMANTRSVRAWLKQLPDEADEADKPRELRVRLMSEPGAKRT